jgi:hypothetical protein
VKLFRCDKCGLTASAKDGEDFAEDWDHVTISETFHYDVCETCALFLFKFFGAIVPGTANDKLNEDAPHAGGNA